MDLENRLLEALSLYDPHLETFAKMRAAVYSKSNDEDLRELADELVERHLLNAVNQLIPDDETLDNEALELCERREEVMKHLCDNGYSEQFRRFDQGDWTVELMFGIVAWTGAQAFTSWRGKPWRRLAEVILDEEN